MANKRRIFDLIGIISIVIVVICFICMIVMSFIITQRFPIDNYEDLLINYATHRLIYSLESIISLISGVFVIPATIGVFLSFYSKIKQDKKNWLFIPTIATIIGSILLVGLIVVKLYSILHTAPDYVSAYEPTKIILLEIFESRVWYLSIFQVVAYLLLFTIGTGIFGILSLKYSLTKGTSTWLAIFTAVFGLGEIGVFIPGTFSNTLIFLASIATILYFFWLGSIVFVIQQKLKEEKKFEVPEKLLTDTS